MKLNEDNLTFYVITPTRIPVVFEIRATGSGGSARWED